MLIFLCEGLGSEVESDLTDLPTLLENPRTMEPTETRVPMECDEISEEQPAEYQAASMTEKAAESIEPRVSMECDSSSEEQSTEYRVAAETERAAEHQAAETEKAA
ncbi:hypothetical protein GGH18_004174, partial [Coemansia sp. RSA 530]